MLYKYVKKLIQKHLDFSNFVSNKIIMSFLKNIFGGTTSNKKSENNEEAKFYTLNSNDEFETIDKVSHQKPVVLFKHSTRCSISRFALKRFDAEYNFTDEQMDWYLLDLLSFREVSNEITSRYNVVHQSPQIVVIKNGKAIYTASHDDIVFEDLKQFV